jgi:hypothetical protein
MTCAQLRAALELGTRGIRPSLRDNALRHVQSCAQCRRELGAQEALEESIRALRAPPTSGPLDAAVMAQLASPGKPLRNDRRPLVLLPLALTSAAAMLAALTAGGVGDLLWGSSAGGILSGPGAVTLPATPLSALAIGLGAAGAWWLLTLPTSGGISTRRTPKGH